MPRRGQAKTHWMGRCLLQISEGSGQHQCVAISNGAGIWMRFSCGSTARFITSGRRSTTKEKSLRFSSLSGGIGRLQATHGGGARVRAPAVVVPHAGLRVEEASRRAAGHCAVVVRVTWAAASLRGRVVAVGDGLLCARERAEVVHALGLLIEVNCLVAAGQLANVASSVRCTEDLA